MEITFFSILAIGFLLGMKHAIEPDHIIAVSTIACQSKSIWRSSLAGVFWGIGHTFTLLIVSVIMLLLKREIPEVWAGSIEFLVGLMLVYLGLSSIYSAAHRRSHQHEGDHIHPHLHVSYVKSALIGMVHGLAGSAAMLMLTMATVKNVWEAALYILIFGGGTVVGMLGFTTILGAPFVLSSKKISVNKALNRITGTISAVYGFYYMYEKGIVEGLLAAWLK